MLAYNFNNDGYVDFFINSNSNDREALGTTNGNDNHFTDLFLNDPQHPGQFRRQYVTFGSIPAISEGAIAVADFNNDGHRIYSSPDGAATDAESMFTAYTQLP